MCCRCRRSRRGSCGCGCKGNILYFRWNRCLRPARTTEAFDLSFTSRSIAPASLSVFSRRLKNKKYHQTFCARWHTTCNVCFGAVLLVVGSGYAWRSDCCCRWLLFFGGSCCFRYASTANIDGARCACVIGSGVGVPTLPSAGL